ncbi:MAG: hypothetical protein K9M45_06860, partial [Kiritimatiellales bacterium]|nr:hypothetical protein [Kiritimatiellales bacterium]
MRHKRNYLITIALLLPLLTGAVEKSDLDVQKISETVADALPLLHLNQLPLNDHVATNAFNLFIGSLDPGHSYFLQSDIDRFHQRVLRLDNELKKGDVSFANDVFGVL